MPLLQGPAFGTSTSQYLGEEVIATAEGPTFAAESDGVQIVLLRGASTVRVIILPRVNVAVQCTTVDSLSSRVPACQAAE